MKISRLLLPLTIGVVLVLAAELPAKGQVCRQPIDQQFYQDNAYVIRKIELRHPLKFIFLVRNRLETVKKALSLSEGQPFTKSNYNASAEIVERAIKSDDAFGDVLSRAKLVVVTSSIENCHEAPGSPKTLDVVYRIFSTDPIPSIRSMPERRQASVEEPATSAAEESTRPFYKLRPLAGYEDARRGYGGVDLLIRIPGQIFDDLHLLASGSPTSRLLEFQLNGSKTVGLSALDHVDYHISYHYTRSPVSDLSLNKGSVQAHFTGFSKPYETESSRVLLRYGAAIELGNQQSNTSATVAPLGIVTDSAYGSVRMYAGLTRTTRYSEAAISYGLHIGGPGLGGLTFFRQVGDGLYSRRFPAGTHSPWDIQARFSVGAITGSKNILINDRFFGGNSVSPFIPGDAWIIPAGPIIRSIPVNRLNAGGFGGTSFYSTNFTIGKVIVYRPLIPKEIEGAEGFDSGIIAAENTAERFFADDYLASSDEFRDLAIIHSGRLKTDLDTLGNTFIAIRASGTVTPALDQILKNAERQARLAQNIIRHATVPDARGRINALVLVTLLNPTTSRLVQLNALLPKMQPLVSPETSASLGASQTQISQHLADLRVALDSIKADGPGHENSPGAKAEARAHRDMIRPREVIDTLRHEVNSYSFSVVAIFDAARIWPDPFATRYAIGAGGRFSVVNVNFTGGYAFNPHPRRELGQGRGAMVFSLTYTNLFR